MADVQPQDPYRILGVPRTATKEEVQAAYKRKARELHPDVNPSPDAEERFREIAAAYAILKDDAQRRDTTASASGAPDRTRRRAPAPDADATILGIWDLTASASKTSTSMSTTCRTRLTTSYDASGGARPNESDVRCN